MIFATAVFLLGGGSRYDIESVGPLRAFSAVVAAITLWWSSSERLVVFKWPLALLAMLAILMALQLIPLPYSLWSSLPGREPIVAVTQSFGIAETPRPLTFSPVKTWNSLGSLVVPLAALLLLSLLGDEGWRKLRLVVIFAGLASALLGFAQLALPDSPGLYLYEITNRGSAVGLFSNRNHNALFLCIALLITLSEVDRTFRSKNRAHMILFAAAFMVLVIGVMVNASRFGLVLLALVSLTAAIGSVQTFRARSNGPNNGPLAKIVGVACVIFSLALIGLFAVMDRIPALDRTFAQSLDDEQRFSTFSVISNLALDHFPFGVGFGAFEQAYRTVETTEMLTPRYLNHAHNDVLQIVVEGGIGGVIIVLTAIVFVLRATIQLVRAERSNAYRRSAILGLLVLLMIAMHSFVDYPLRTPALMLVAAIAVGLICRFRMQIRYD